MKIFADFHHSSLMRSLQLLFEERLGHELYRPIGIEWYDQKYWKIADPYPNPRDTALQFLDTRGGGYEKEKNLNGDYQVDDEGIYKVYDPDHNTWYKAVTLDKFREVKFDVVVASYIDHIASFRKLINDSHSQAKLVHQMGNNWATNLNWGEIDNVMASTAPFSHPNKNVVFYHQEVDPKIFTYETTYTPKTIMSFVNILAGKDLAMFLELEKQLPNYNFYSYGAGGRDGSLPVVGHAEKLKQTQFVFHWKEGGDGFGHVIFSAFACGKPPIVNMSQYKGQFAHKLMVDGVTCIDVGSLAPPDAAKKIVQFSDDETYTKMSVAAYNRFQEVVDYDKEEQMIKTFLEKLL